MIPALLTALLVALVGARVRPTPRPRHPAGPARPVRSNGGPTHGRGRSTPRLRGGRRVPASGPGAVAEWCDGLARAVRGGATLVGAIRATEPPAGSGDVVGAIILRLDRGAPLDAAVNELSTRASADEHLRLALTVIGACADHGGPPAEPLDRVAAALRDRAADLAERGVQSSQARASARVMTVLPLAMLGVLVASSAAVRAAMFGPGGAALLVVGAGLNLVGWRWMDHVVTPGRR